MGDHPRLSANADYHGTYVAAADVAVPSFGSLLCVSVHASPTQLTKVDHVSWTGELARLRRPSPSPPIWHSDQILSDVSHMVKGPTLVAGNLNEARGWDDKYGGHFGEDWFAIAEEAGLHDLGHFAVEGGATDARRLSDRSCPWH
jgi:hypothetical protein